MKAWNNKDIGELSGNTWGRLVYDAKRRGLELKITARQAYNVFVKQGGRCAYTGEYLTHRKYGGRVNGKTKYIPGTASLDRKDSSKGYVKGNIQWVHKALNAFKGDLSEREFLELCDKVSRWNKCKRS